MATGAQSASGAEGGKGKAGNPQLLFWGEPSLTWGRCRHRGAKQGGPPSGKTPAGSEKLHSTRQGTPRLGVAPEEALLCFPAPGSIPGRGGIRQSPAESHQQGEHFGRVRLKLAASQTPPESPEAEYEGHRPLARSLEVGCL